MDTRNPVVELRGVVKRFGRKTVLPGLDLAVVEGEFLTLLGPSGCGKTTVLRLIAGFESPDAGEISLDGQRVDDVPPQHRSVNTVFQSYALFPHMTVYENVAFGLRVGRIRRRELGPRVEEALRMVRLSDLARRKPHQLSGGEQQRVALARAVVNRPRVLLLDEPLNALDYKLRKEMQIELKHLQRQLGMTFLFVTHDQEEALSVSDRVAVIREGRIEQMGTPRQIYESPANLFVARFVGETNVFDGIVTAQLDPGTVEASVEGVRCALRVERPFRVGDRVHVLLRPEDLRIRALGEPERDPRALAGKVVERTYKGTTLDSVIALDSGKKALASEFFDEGSPSLDRPLGERVTVGWVKSWEVVLPDEKQEPL